MRWRWSPHFELFCCLLGGRRCFHCHWNTTGDDRHQRKYFSLFIVGKSFIWPTCYYLIFPYQYLLTEHVIVLGYANKFYSLSLAIILKAQATWFPYLCASNWHKSKVCFVYRWLLRVRALLLRRTRQEKRLLARRKITLFATLIFH